MEPTRRGFVALAAGLLGWSIAPHVVRAATPASKKSRHEAVWVIKSEQWMELTIGSWRVNVVRLRKRNRDYEEGVNTYRWWKPDEWMLQAGGHPIISGNDIAWIKGEAERHVRDLMLAEEIVNTKLSPD